MTVFNTLAYGIELGDAENARQAYKKLMCANGYDDDDDDDANGRFFDQQIDSFSLFCDDSIAVLYDSRDQGTTNHNQDKDPDVVWELECLDDAERTALQTKLRKAAETLLGKPCFAQLSIYSIASAC